MSDSEFTNSELFISYLKTIRADLLKVREDHTIRLSQVGITSKELSKFSMEWAVHGLRLKFDPDRLDINLDELFSPTILKTSTRLNQFKIAKRDRLSPLELVSTVKLLSTIEELSNHDLILLATGYSFARIELGVTEDNLIRGNFRLKQARVAKNPRKSRLPQEFQSHIIKVLDLRKLKASKTKEVLGAILDVSTNLGLICFKKEGVHITYTFNGENKKVSISAVKNFLSKQSSK